MANLVTNTNYTYEDFLNKKNANPNLYVSDSDMKLAKDHPDAGMTLLDLKINHGKAKTPEEAQGYNDQANQVRSSYGNYTGGLDGSQYIVDDPTPRSRQYEAFESQYANDLNNTLQKVLNRKGWSYDADNDQAYQAARKQYLREANRATQDTMGQYASMTGGMPSTAAVSAASQAGDYYRTQLSDQLGQYMDRDYQRYIDNIGLDFDTLSALSSLEQNERGEWDTDRNFDYNQWTDDLSFRTDRDNTRYAREQEAEQQAYDRAWNENQRDYERNQYSNERNEAKIMDVYDALMQQYEVTQDSTYRKRAEELLKQLNVKGTDGKSITY